MTIRGQDERRRRAREIIARRLREFYEYLKADASANPEQFLARLELEDEETNILGAENGRP